MTLLPSVELRITELYFIIDELCNIYTVIEQNRINIELNWAEKWHYFLLYSLNVS